MSSNLKVNSIVPAAGSNVAIGTAGGTITYNAPVSGISTFIDGISVGTGTSISSPATNVLTLGTNSVERVRILSNGRVGIGTTNPLGLGVLAVSGGVSNPAITFQNGSATNTASDALVGSIVGYSRTAGGNINIGSVDIRTDTGSASSGAVRILTASNGVLAETLRVDSSGRVTIPNQPIFMAYGNTSQTLDTGAVPQKIAFTATEDIDNGGYFDAPNSNFNVPVTGKYFVYASVMLNSNFTDYNYIFMDFGKNDTRISREIMCPRPGGGQFVSVQGSAIISAAAGDTLQVYLVQSGGTAAGVRNAYRHFAGYLIG